MHRSKVGASFDQSAVYLGSQCHCVHACCAKVGGLESVVVEIGGSVTVRQSGAWQSTCPVSHPVVIFRQGAEQFTWVDVHVLTVRFRVLAQPRRYVHRSELTQKPCRAAGRCLERRSARTSAHQASVMGFL
jgi:hypothetical protein